ncbi:MAG: DUF4238 domain-containing protein [Undibacterium sp.]|nr:DUF4238 domain-containing protein [Undibacterium sp.]
MPDNKKHHYVPVFYLKLFSPDEKSINLFNIKNEKAIYQVPLRNQCYRDYFYGNSGDEERALGQIESIAAVSIKRMIDTTSIPKQSNYDYGNILIFLHVQSLRTAYQADAINEMSDKFFKYILSPQIEQEIPDIDLSKFRIDIMNAGNIGVYTALTSYTMLIDMGWVLARTEGGEFITCDTPVQFLNPFLGESNGLSNAGISAKGLIITYPLTPNLSLILFDREVYRLNRVTSTDQMAIASSDDIDKLNVLQAANCYENFYYYSDDFDALSIYKRANKFRRTEKYRQRTFPQSKTDAERRELIVTSQVGVNYPLDLSFLVIKKEAKRWLKEYLKQRFRPSIVERNPQLSSIHREYRELEKSGIQLPPILDFLKERLGQYQTISPWQAKTST